MLLFHSYKRSYNVYDLIHDARSEKSSSVAIPEHQEPRMQGFRRWNQFSFYSLALRPKGIAQIQKIGLVPCSSQIVVAKHTLIVAGLTQ